MKRYVKQWPDRVWAVEGANGAGRPLAQRLVAVGEQVVDVPAKLAPRVRLFDTGRNRKTDALDALDAHSIAVVAVRTEGLRVVAEDGELEALRMLTDRRDELAHQRVQTVNRLQRLDGFKRSGCRSTTPSARVIDVVGLVSGTRSRFTPRSGHARRASSGRPCGRWCRRRASVAAWGRETMVSVLVVDDDADIRDLIGFTLRRRGYNVSSHEDPLAALAHATSTGFDVALLDWSMPVMNGGELCARLRELPGLRDTPILIVTAHADRTIRDQAVAAGATGFLAKPFSLKQLADVVAELLDPAL